MAKHYVIALIIIMAGILLARTMNETQSIFPQDTVLFRPLFDLPHDYPIDSIKKAGTITLPQGTNLSAIESVSYIARGCSKTSGASRKLVLSGKDFGSINFNTCDNLFYDDYQHYEEKTISHEAIGSFELKSYNLNFALQDSGAITIQEHRLVFNEKVGCTRSSQCPVILIANEQVQAECSQVYHQCEITEFVGIGFGKRPVSESDTVAKPPVEKPKKESNSVLFLILLISALGIGGYFVIKKK